MSPLTSPQNLCVLLVKTDSTFVQQASFDLKQLGYTTAIASNTDLAWTQFEQTKPSMVVLDRTTTGRSGFNFCRRIRNSGSRIPVLILVEQATVEERVDILEAGADDYLLKPYQKQGFLQLIDLYLQPPIALKQKLGFSDLVLDLTTRRVFRKEISIDLTMKEFELLKYLMSHPNEVLTREQILENVWGYDFRGASNVIEVYIRYLRLKIEGEGQKRLIHTVRGVGYVLREPK